MFIELLFALAIQERIVLSVPETAPTNTTNRVNIFSIVEDNPNTPVDEGTLTIEFVGTERPDNPNRCQYNSATTPTGTFLIVALNKANLSTAYAGNATTGSLKQRIHHRLIVMGESAQVCSRPITGSLTGAPQ